VTDDYDFIGNHWSL